MLSTGGPRDSSKFGIVRNGAAKSSRRDWAVTIPTGKFPTYSSRCLRLPAAEPVACKRDERPADAPPGGGPRVGAAAELPKPAGNGRGFGRGMPADGGTKPAGRPMFRGLPASSTLSSCNAVTAISSSRNSTKANLPSPDICTHATGGPIVGEYPLARVSDDVKNSLSISAVTTPVCKFPTYNSRCLRPATWRGTIPGARGAIPVVVCAVRAAKSTSCETTG
mmetsp:Transcript_68549/g.113917  ORF Transcript_68549/g.113917 Transcript_68549/m.113917 type:complete len:222 (+) Transcript_68549:1006-1671(+)